MCIPPKQPSVGWGIVLNDYFSRTIFLYIFLLITICGCSSSESQSTVPVEGVLQLNGKPLADAFVTFTPDQGRSATGKTNVDGIFTLGTFSTGDGATVGKHRVTVMAREKGPEPSSPVSDQITPPGRSLIPTKYENSVTSGLTFEVREGAENHFQINLISQGESAR